MTLDISSGGWPWIGWPVTPLMDASLAQSNLHPSIATCLTFSLLHVVIDSSLVATITIVQGDPDGGDEDDRDGVVASPSQAALHREIASR